MKVSRPAVLALLIGVALFTAPNASADDEISFEKVRPGVWAALQPQALRFNDSNSVVIVSDGDVIVIDSQANPASSRRLIDRIGQLTEKPIRYLVNTHFHSDHTRANFVYRDRFPNLEIIGHETLIEDIPSRAAPDLDGELELYRREIPGGKERLARGVSRGGEMLDETGKATLAGQIEAAEKVLAELEKIRWAVPSLGTTSLLTLHRSAGPIHIRPVHAHTRGDLVIHLPEAGVLITGDVLDDLPFGGHGYPGDWIDILTELESLEWDLMIPGHGRIREGDEAREHLARVRGLFELMLRSARAAAESDLELEDAQSSFLESEALAPFRDQLAGDDPVAGRAFDNFVPAGFERAFLEVMGPEVSDRLPD